MKNIETILTQLTDTDTVMESLYRAVAGVDPAYAEEMSVYESALQTLIQEVSGAQECLKAMRQELVSDIRFAMWQGFMWNLDCFRNPVNKLLVNMDFEELCQENRMHTLPAAQAVQRKIVLPRSENLPSLFIASPASQIGAPQGSLFGF